VDAFGPALNPAADSGSESLEEAYYREPGPWRPFSSPQIIGEPSEGEREVRPSTGKVGRRRPGVDATLARPLTSLRQPVRLN
jgi:hypothetical protein